MEHNLSALKMLQIRDLVEINARFFLNFLGWQSMMAFFLAAFVGPGQVSPDLANNALPLYLARPFSRAEYVLGKMSVLLILMSVMTWIPGLLLFVLQALSKATAGSARTCASPARYFSAPGSGFCSSPCWRWRSPPG